MVTPVICISEYRNNIYLCRAVYSLLIDTDVLIVENHLYFDATSLRHTGQDRLF